MGEKASAIAHPVQRLIRTHEPAETDLRISLHDSISVCTAPLMTHTTIEFGDFETDNANVEGSEVFGRELELITELVNLFRLEADCFKRFKAVAKSNFPTSVGLGSSPSVFASLTLAACNALGLELKLQEISKLASKVYPTSAMALTGGFSRLRMKLGDRYPYSDRIDSSELQIGMLVFAKPLDPRPVGVRPEVPPSLPRPSRAMEVAKIIEEMELAIREGDVGKICMLAERDTLLLHGVSMTGVGDVLAWRPETLRVINTAKKLRESEVPAFFSVDVDEAVYINTFPDRVAEVEKKVLELDAHYWKCEVGGEAKIIDEHLF
jgi:phosphomevalonate decarboxylase